MARIALPAMALLVLCGTGFASGTAEQCSALAKQYDIASKDKVDPAKLKKSQAHRARGADLCGQGKPDAGVKALEAALKEIGLKPAN